MGKSLLPVALIALIGCATSPRPAVRAPQVVPRPLATGHLSDFRQALEEAQRQIAARSEAGVFPVIHADAALAMPIPDHPSINRSLAYFNSTLHASIQQSLYRSAPYKRLIDAALDEYRLPRALAYLPVIESGYMPRLTSRVGARGIWQFMPDTAREYGLRINWWIDERAHPEKSTRAAAAYLRDLYDEFGDWPLVLAAYNWGPGRVRRALREFGASTFWELSDRAALPRETRGYVPTFYATIVIVSDPEMFGFTLPAPRPLEQSDLPIDGPVSLAFLATTGGMNQEQLADLNPELRHGVTPPGPYRIRVPSAAAPLLASRATTLRRDDPFVQVSTFALRPGQSVASVSRQLGLKLDEVREMNHGRTDSKTIFLPLRQRELSMRLAERYHVVRHGETLYTIARANGLTVAELRELNRLPRQHVIRTGERLLVSVRGAVLAGN